MEHRSFPGSVSRCRTAAAPPCWRPLDSARPPCSGCSAGSLTPQGGSITGLPAEGIAMVIQEDRLLPGCTVLENLRLVAPERPDTELIALLGELGLSGWENARPGKLSGGMRRRAAIARRWYSTARWSSWTSRSRDWTKPPWRNPRLCGPLAGGPHLPAGDPQPSGGGTPGLPGSPVWTSSPEPALKSRIKKPLLPRNGTGEVFTL